MKFCIFGAGGTGGVLAAYLAMAGNDVTVIACGTHLAAIQEHGLTLRTNHRGTEQIKSVSKPALQKNIMMCRMCCWSA